VWIGARRTGLSLAACWAMRALVGASPPVGQEGHYSAWSRPYHTWQRPYHAWQRHYHAWYSSYRACRSRLPSLPEWPEHVARSGLRACPVRDDHGCAGSDAALIIPQDAASHLDSEILCGGPSRPGMRAGIFFGPVQREVKTVLDRSPGEWHTVEELLAAVPGRFDRSKRGWWSLTVRTVLWHRRADRMTAGERLE